MRTCGQHIGRPPPANEMLRALSFPWTILCHLSPFLLPVEGTCTSRLMKELRSPVYCCEESAGLIGMQSCLPQPTLPITMIVLESAQMSSPLTHSAMISTGDTGAFSALRRSAADQVSVAQIHEPGHIISFFLGHILLVHCSKPTSIDCVR
jgi:hypothetical protein